MPYWLTDVFWLGQQIAELTERLKQQQSSIYDALLSAADNEAKCAASQQESASFILVLIWLHKYK